MRYRRSSVAVVLLLVAQVARILRHFDEMALIFLFLISGHLIGQLINASNRGATIDETRDLRLALAIMLAAAATLSAFLLPGEETEAIIWFVAGTTLVGAVSGLAFGIIQGFLGRR